MEFLWNNTGATPEPRPITSKGRRQGQVPGNAYPAQPPPVSAGSPSGARATTFIGRRAYGAPKWPRIPHVAPALRLAAAASNEMEELE